MSQPDPRSASRFAVLANRDFRLYWIGTLISQVGTWMQVVAEGWIVLRLTGSVAALGAINFAFALPSLLLSLFGGAAADRGNRRAIVIASQLALMVTAFVMAALVATHTVTFWALLGAAVVGGVAMAYDMPARQALIPTLVAPHQIPSAISLGQVSFNGSRLLGPALAAVAIAKLGLASVYVFNGVSFLAVIGGLLMIRSVRDERAAGAAGASRAVGAGSTLAAIREGLAYVAASRLLRSVFALSALVTLFAFPALAVLSTAYVRDVLRLGPGAVGTLMSVSGGASMLGAIAMLWIPAARRGHGMAVAVVVGAAAIAALVLGPATLLKAGVAFAFMSASFSVLMGLQMTLVQQAVPGALRGRVMSVSGLTFSGVMPVAGLGMSIAVDRLGFTAVYLANAVMFVVAGLAVLAYSGLLSARPPVAEPAPAVERTEGPSPVAGAEPERPAAQAS